MHCVAQIDLAEVSALKLDLNLPKSGGLVFLANTGSFSGFDHTAAVREVSADDLGVFSPAFRIDTLYGDDWHYDQHGKGACSREGAPRSFPRWPLSFTAANQFEVDDGENGYTPSLDDILGPEASSVHLELAGLISNGEWETYQTYEGEQRRVFRASEDASPFPVRAVQMIVNDAIYGILDRFRKKYSPTKETFTFPTDENRVAQERITPQTTPVDNNSAGHLAMMRKNTEAALATLPLIEKWQSVLVELDPDQPLGKELSSEFTQDLVALKSAFRSYDMRFRFGSGTTITGSAALRAYFDMYCGSRRSFEAIPESVRAEIENVRMRTAFGYSMPHQIGGFGTDVQESNMLERGMVLLLQVATDEAVGYMWGDVGVLQYWISPDDLAHRRWSNVEFLIHAH